MTSNKQLTFSKPSLRSWLGILVFVLALGVRVIGIHWGLKDSMHHQSLHPDEEVNYRVSTAINPAKLQFTPGYYNYGTLYFTLFRVCDDAVAAYTGGTTHPGDDWGFIARCEMGARIMSVLAGAWLALLAFLITDRLSSIWGAFAAGLCIAFSPGLVVHSDFATVDMVAALFLGLSTLYGVKLAVNEAKDAKQQLKFVVLSAVFAGLSAGTKYSGALGILMPLAVLAWVRPKNWVRDGLVGVGAMVLVFLASVPGIILDQAQFLKDFDFELAHSASGHGLTFIGTSSGFLYQISNLLLGMGSILVLIGVVGLSIGVAQKKLWAVLLLVFAIPYYIVIGRAEVKFFRYCLPLCLPLAVGFGYAFGECEREKGYKKAGVALGILGLGGVGGGGLNGASRFVWEMSKPDNRELAAKYIAGLSGPTTSVGLVSDPWFWSPTVFPDVAMVRMIPFPVRDQLRMEAKQPVVLQYVPQDYLNRKQWDPRLISAMHPDFIAYSDFESNDYERISAMNPIPADEADDIARYQQFMDLLKRNYQLVKVFGSGVPIVHDMRYVCPTVYVWKKLAPN